MSAENYDTNVFINCPFDGQYHHLFQAIVFTAIACDFDPHCALEVEDSAEETLQKIFDIMGKCRLGIHDMSRTELDEINKLPRFNMPLELGMFLGIQKFGEGEHQRKVCLVLERKKYRFERFISDIAGKQVVSHSDDAPTLIKAVRDWLSKQTDRLLPGGAVLAGKYHDFGEQLPAECARLQLDAPEQLNFHDFKVLATG